MQTKEEKQEKYKAPNGKEGAYHVSIENVKFDEKGNRLSKPFVQVYGAKGWLRSKNILIKAGYEVKVLHSPAKINIETIEEKKPKKEEK